MFNHDELSQAIELQRRSYNLLLWLGSAVTKGVVRFDRAAACRSVWRWME